MQFTAQLLIAINIALTLIGRIGWVINGRKAVPPSGVPGTLAVLLIAAVAAFVNYKAGAFSALLAP
jgi:hypothetical protein